MDKRYQVFVSSTYTDLIEERHEVMNALLELDCIPAGMELFPAADENQWTIIKRIISESDYYLLILGGRYGSIGPEGISYTEMEYNYAISIKKPVIAFLHRDTNQIAAGKCENSDAGKNNLTRFRAICERKHCKYWGSPQELGSVASRSLVQLIKTNPAPGWVRATELASGEAMKEILSLRNKISQLEKEIENTRNTGPEEAKSLAQGEETIEIVFSFTSRNKTFTETEYKSSVIITWNDLISSVLPTMIDSATDNVIAQRMNKLVEEIFAEETSENSDFEGCWLRNFKIKETELEKIIIQLRALGLIRKHEKLKSPYTHWTLTPYGDQVMTKLIAIPTKSGKQS